MKVTCTVFNPENPGSIYVGTNEHVTIWIDGVPSGFTYTDGIYKSLNGGNLWEKIFFFDGEQNRRLDYVKYIIIDPTDTTKMYIGGKNDSYFTSIGCKFTSHNSGKSWTTNRLTTISSQSVMAMACTPKDYESHRVCSIVGSGSARRFFLSYDYGITWQEFNEPSSFDFNGNLRDNAIYISADFPKWIQIGAEYIYEDKYASAVAFNIEAEKWYYYPEIRFNYPTSILSNYEVDYLGFRYDGVYKYSMTDDTWYPKQY